MAERTVPLRLSDFADQLEAQQAPHNLVLHMRAAADEIERLRIRLEIDPSHPYDGIYCRDETIRGLEKQIASLLNALADARTESMRLRAALREIVSLDDEPKCCGKGIAGYDSPPECCGDPERGIDRAQSIARAALEEGRT